MERAYIIVMSIEEITEVHREGTCQKKINVTVKITLS